MIDILPTLSFGSNLKPSHITQHVREVLIRVQRRLYRRFLITPFIIAFVDVVLFVFTGVNAGAMPWTALLFWEAVFLIAVLVVVWLVYARQTRFLRDAVATTAAVMEARTLSLWGVQLYRKPLPGTLKQAMEEEDLGDDPDTFHLVTVRLRFVPGTVNEDLDWPLLKDEAPHCDVTKRISGGWGSFASELKPGSLVSVLYDPTSPKYCRIVKLQNWQKNVDLE